MKGQKKSRLDAVMQSNTEMNHAIRWLVTQVRELQDRILVLESDFEREITPIDTNLKPKKDEKTDE